MPPNMVYSILLLICALVAADTVPPCDRSLIRGVKDAEIEWKRADDGSVTLKCVSAENAPRAIMYNSTRFVGAISCNSIGWKGEREDDFHPREMVDAGAPLEISCVKYCEWTGGGIKANFPDNGNGMRLRCANTSHGMFYNDLLLAIGASEWRLKRYASCGLHLGWRLNGGVYKSREITSDTATPQHFECKEVPDCAIPFVEGPHQLLYDEQAKRLTCVTSEDAPRTIKRRGGYDYGFKSVICDNGRWKYDNNEEIYSRSEFECADYCEIREESGVKQVSIFVGTEKHVEVSCEANWLELNQGGERVHGDRARCSLAGWTDGNNDRWSAHVFGRFYCERPPKCSTQGGYPRVERRDKYVSIGPPIVFGLETKCTQRKNELTAISTHSKRYLVLFCVKFNAAWIGTDFLWTEADLENEIASAHSRLNVTCVDYCKIAGTATNITWTDIVAHVSCEEPNDYLIYGGDRVIPGGVTYCTLRKGWMIGSDESSNILLTNDTETSARFDCSPNRPTTTTTTIAPTTTTTTTMTTTTTSDITEASSNESIEKAEAQTSTVVIGCAIGGFIVVAVIIAAIVVLLMRKKRRPENSGSDNDGKSGQKMDEKPLSGP